MDVAKRLADFRDQPPEQWLTALNRYAPPVATAGLVLAIAYELATLTWTFVPSAIPTAAPVPTGRSGVASAPTNDFGALTQSHLFGEAPSEPAPVAPAAVDAPETTLSLALVGIVSYATDPAGPGSIATISANRGEQRNYHVGQPIENTDGATLHSVYADRVLINRRGQLEALRLPKELLVSTSSVASSPLPQSAPAANNSLRQVISDNATRFTDIVRIAPHVQEGQMVGFRVTPGRDRTTFERLGLQPGDIVTDINGTVLNDPTQGLQVFQSLGETTQANVTVMRDGVPQVLVVDTTQLQTLQENRQ